MEVQTIPQDIKSSHNALNGFKGTPNGSPRHQLDQRQESSHQSKANGEVNSTASEANERPLPSLEDLERELPHIDDGQVYLGFVMHQLVQDLYAQLLNVAETIGRAPDSVKKAKLQAWLSHAYKQSSKLYVLTKYSRNAPDIQKAMNIAAFLRTQGEQIIWATKALHTVQDESHRLRIRNPDLLTALDVLTTGTYTRLPSRYAEEFVPLPKMSDREVADVFVQVEDLMRMRLLCRDVVPVEMRKWRIEGGRTFFTVPKRFEASLIMTGAQKDDVWAFVHVEFLFGLPEGERKGSREFPRQPPKAFSDDLAFQVRDIIMAPTLPDDQLYPNIPVVPLTSAVVDAPLVRVYNFLQLLSLTYQLEILIFQAIQLHEFGWKDCLRVRVAPDRKSLTVQYWVRPPIPLNAHGALPPAAYLQNSAISGGEIIISIVPVTAPPNSSSSQAQPPHSSSQPTASQRTKLSQQQLNSQPDSNGQSTSGQARTPIDRIKAQMQERLKLRGGGKPPDEVEQHRFEVTWKPSQGALGVMLVPLEVDTGGLEVDSDCLDFEGLLKTVLRRHADGIMAKHLENAQSSNMTQLFPHPEDVRYIEHNDGAAMRVQLAGEQHIIITIENQTGKFLIHESGDLGATLRGVRWKNCQSKINQEPAALLEYCARLRYAAILELVESRANLLGITTFRHRHLVPASMQKFGKYYGIIFCQLGMFPRHYVAILVTEGGFKFALVEVSERDSEFGMGIGEMVITDFGLVQAEKFLGIGTTEDDMDDSDTDVDEMDGVSDREYGDTGDGLVGSRKRKRAISDVGVKISSDPPITALKDPFDISIRELRDLHAYCRARVAHIHIEHQLKTRSIPYVHVRAKKLLPAGHPPHSNGPAKGSSRKGTKGPISTWKSPFMPYLPILCVQSSDLLAGAAAAEAAMPNIRIEPTEWWTLDKECMVNTSVQLKYVQPLDGGGGHAGASTRRNGEAGTMITPSENISYDPRTSVVTFLSRKVGDCVDEFLTEWARVSKVVVIARQVSLMPTVKNWKDVRILSFDLQTVEFAYCQDYAVSVTSVEGNYKLSFFRCSLPSSSQADDSKTSPHYGSSMDIDAPSLPPSQSQSVSQAPPPQSQTTPSHSQSSYMGSNNPGWRNDPARRNPHEDSSRYAQKLLKDERLGASVFEMVGFLRNTVGIVEILDILEDSAEAADTPGKDKAKGSKPQFDVLVKAAGWWRIQYSTVPLLTLTGGNRYGLDMRIINGRVMVVDGSVDLHANKGEMKSRGGGMLMPIPNMAQLVKAVLEEAKDLPNDNDGVVAVNYGDAVICGSAGAPKIVKGLHEKILGVL